MGLCGAKVPESYKQELAASRAADRLQAQAEEADNKIVKLLLLGTGDSGKSTIFKQMRILYGKGFSHDDLVASVSLIRSNCIEAIRTLVEQVDVLGIPCSCRADAERIMELGVDSTLDPTAGDLILRVWRDAAVQKAYEERSQFQLVECARVFLDDIARITSLDYVPTITDVLNARKTTSGMYCEQYLISGSEFHVYDVGGQRNERKKWIHHFDNVTALVFVASMSEYNQSLYEFADENRLVESVNVFRDISNSPWFGDKSIILFLNKQDLLVEKLQRHDIRQPDKELFMDYTGGCLRGPDDKETLTAAQDYLKGLYIRQVMSNPDRIYTHYTCATDVSLMSKVLDSTKLIILENIINSDFV